MSWQAYVDDHLVGSRKVQRAIILGRDSGAVWASSAGYTLSNDQRKTVTKAFNNPDTWAHGIHLASEKFITTTCDSDRIYGRKGANGCVIVKTNQAILVAEYDAPVQAAEAAGVVEKLAEYLKQHGS